MSLSLTPRQAKLMAFLKERIEADGVAPTFEEMSAALGINKSRIHDLLSALEQRGRIRRLRYRSRAIEILDEPPASDIEGIASLALTRAGAQTSAANISAVARALRACLQARNP